MPGKGIFIFINFTGFKVARIEQTETPADLEVRVKKMSRPTKFDKVVRREICQITTLGTKINGSRENSYLTAICGQKSLSEEGKIVIGLCFLDTSMGLVHLSQFLDDKELSCLETLLAFYPPVEILVDRKTSSIFTDFLGKFSYVNKRLMNFPDASKTLKNLHDYYGGGKNEWPGEISNVHLDESDNLGLSAKKSSEQALAAFGAIINYLSESMIDSHILNQKQIKNIDPPLDIKAKVQDEILAKNMILDNKTLKNLDIIPNLDHPEVASLFSVIDNTLTNFGKRLLRQWLCMPLLKIQDIQERQEILKHFENSLETVQVLKNELKGIPDLEKLVSSIHASGIKLPEDHPEQRAIYYEQATYASRKVSKLLMTLDALDKLQDLFKSKLPSDESIFTKSIVEDFPDVSKELDFFKVIIFKSSYVDIVVGG